MNRHDPDDLLETIISRAAALLGTPHGFIYLLEPDGESLVVRHGIGLFTDFLGYRMPVDSGLAGLVYREGRPVAVDDYDAWAERAGGHADARVRCRRRRPADVRRPRRRRDRARVGQRRADVRHARDRAP